jgi:hypothetical protein
MKPRPCSTTTLSSNTYGWALIGLRPSCAHNIATMPLEMAAGNCARTPGLAGRRLKTPPPGPLPYRAMLTTPRPSVAYVERTRCGVVNLALAVDGDLRLISVPRRPCRGCSRPAPTQARPAGGAQRAADGADDRFNLGSMGTGKLVLSWPDRSKASTAAGWADPQPHRDGCHGTRARLSVWSPPHVATRLLARRRGRWACGVAPLLGAVAV